MFDFKSPDYTLATLERMMYTDMPQMLYGLNGELMPIDWHNSSLWHHNPHGNSFS